MKNSKPIRVSSVLYAEIIKLAKREGRHINFYLNKALVNLLKSKKIKIKKDWKI